MGRPRAPIVHQESVQKAMNVAPGLANLSGVFGVWEFDMTEKARLIRA